MMLPGIFPGPSNAQSWLTLERPLSPRAFGSARPDLAVKGSPSLRPLSQSHPGLPLGASFGGQVEQFPVADRGPGIHRVPS